jgi:predicted 3-demethylubiquinone-9 3-methyltransferase (glyoxalase superfamily)/uncharacterized protein (DUF427 family)
MSLRKITSCLWFDNQAEEAAKFYCSIFKDSKMLEVTRYGEAGREIHGRPAGSVMTVAFELEGQRFMALNGGPLFKFNESVSFVVECSSQQEIDYYWEKLGTGGDVKAQQCGWLKDRYGLSWQVVPQVLPKFMQLGGTVADSVMSAVLEMKKLDLAEIEKAARAQASHIKTAPAGKRVRVSYRGEAIADTQDALAMTEGSYPVVYYVPRKDVKMDRLQRTSHGSHCPFKGDASYFSIRSGPENAVWSYEQPYDEVRAIKGHLAFYPDKVEIVAKS